MRLVKLSANQASFKSVTFNETGVSLIIGSRKDTLSLDENIRSYNGVGKSLIVEILHFCLGSNSNKSFQQNLENWEFSLEFKIEDKSYIARRTCKKQSSIFLNGTEYKVKAFNEFLGRSCFETPSWGGSQLTFRSLLPRFIRRSKYDYSDPKLTSSDKEPYTSLIRNLFLLGLDTSLAEEKYLLRSRQTDLEDFSKNFKSDPFIREYYTGNKDASLQSKFLEEQINRQELDLSTFQVADDYYAIEKEANEIAQKLRLSKNRLSITENALDNIKRSLETKTDIPRNLILSVYSEVMSAFKEETLRKLSEVEEFHNKLLSNRVARLSQERIRFETEKRSLEFDISTSNRLLNDKLGYLSDKRALDQYASVSAKISELKSQLHKLRDYQQLLHKSQEEAAGVKKKLADEILKTNRYLEESSSEIQKRFQTFSELAKKFYPGAPAGIVLNNNTGDNKIRYDFDIRIEADGSDGINSVKLFCYDFAVLKCKQNHFVKFIFHDSRLFSDIDPRQRAVLFSIAQSESTILDAQYIATVNQDQLETIRSELTESEFQSLLNCEVLRINDDGPQSKLLGIQVDMHYN